MVNKKLLVSKLTLDISMPEIRMISHIVPVGFTPGKLIEGIKQFPVHKVIIVVGKGTEDERVLEAAKAVEKAFKGYAEVERNYVEKEDVFKATKDFINMIKNEKNDGREVYINAAGSLRNLTLASYIAALATKTKIYSSHSRYNEKGEPVGVSRLIDIPYFPIKDPPKEQVEIMEELHKGAVESLDELIVRMRPKIEKRSPEYNSERARLSHHINRLKEDGFVETDKLGKTLSIKLSEIGEIYVEGRKSR